MNCHKRHNVSIFDNIAVPVMHTIDNRYALSNANSPHRAVWIIFLLTSVLMVVTVAHMISGVVAERAVCDPLKQPRNNRLFELVDELLPIKNVLYPKNPKADINMSHIIT